MIDNINLLNILLRLWSNIKTVYEYKHVIPDLSSEIENLYKFNDVEIYGKIVKFGDYNYVFTAESGNYEEVLKYMMPIIDVQKTYVETYRNNELQKDQFVIHMYINIRQGYDSISNFAYESTGNLPIFNTNDLFYLPNKIEHKENNLELVKIHDIKSIEKMLDSDSRIVEFKKFSFDAEVILSGYTFANMIHIDRPNNSSVVLRWYPHALQKFKAYCLQNPNDAFAVLLNGELLTMPIKPLESHVFDNNMWQIAHNLDKDTKIEDELKEGSLRNVFKESKLGYGSFQVVNEYVVDYEDSLFQIFIAVLTLLLILLFFLFIRRRDRRKMAISTALSAIYACAMFDDSSRILYLSLLCGDSLFAFLKDHFSVYIFKVSLYVSILFVSFFVNQSTAILIHTILKFAFMSVGLSFVIENLVSHKSLKEIEEE